MATERRRERLSEWTPEREALVHIADLLGVLATGKTASRVSSLGRPQLAAHRYADRQARRLHDRLHEQLYGSPYRPD